MGPYTIQDLYWAYNLCPMTRSPELLKEEEKTPFTSSRWKIQGQDMRRQTWGILIYLENLCFWVIRINKILWHYVTVIKRWVKKYPQFTVLERNCHCLLGACPTCITILLRCLPTALSGGALPAEQHRAPRVTPHKWQRAQRLPGILVTDGKLYNGLMTLRNVCQNFKNSYHSLEMCREMWERAKVVFT